ncbi:MAG: hypothetical protein ABI910_23770 [Gemmatimonadota bacterium]
MWVLLKSLLAQWAIVKLVLKAFGSLGWLLPIAFVLKALGLPFLLLLAAVALPVILVLALIGLPLLLIVVVGGFLVTFTLWIVGLGVVALKVAIPILLLFWAVRWLMGRGHASDLPPAASDAS